jgi:predicted ATPase
MSQLLYLGTNLQILEPTMSVDEEQKRLEEQLEQAKRLETAVSDQTTVQRIREFIQDLRRRLERYRERRRTEADISRRARALWERAGRPAGRDEEFWLQAERELDETSGE